MKNRDGMKNDRMTNRDGMKNSDGMTNDGMTNSKVRLILVILSILSILFVSLSESIFLPVAQAAGGGNSQPGLGIVGYINIDQNINLDQAKTLFKTVGYQNTDGIIGTYSFYGSNYNIETANLYIARNGFIAAYYMGTDPASKIISWNGDKTIFSKFATVITNVGQSLGYNIDYRNIKYYDYKYPNANRMLIISQSVGKTNVAGFDYGSITFNIPSSVTVYEKSYSIYLNDMYNTVPETTIAIDGSPIIDSMAYNGVIYNFYNTYILTNTNHLFGVMSNKGAQSGSAIVIIYSDDQNKPAITVNGAENYFDGNLEKSGGLGQTAPTYTPSYTEPPTPVPTPRRTSPVPMPTSEITESPPYGGGSGSATVQPTQVPLRPSTVSVNLYGEKTNVELGENIVLKLSAVSLITKPKMHIQVIIIPPSGMSVTSSEFVKSGAGQFTTTYELEPGNGRDIEVKIESNQIGDFNVEGRIVYYFGDDVNSGEDHTLNLPIKVIAKDSKPNTQMTGTQPGNNPKKEPGFEIIFAIGIFILLRTRNKHKKKDQMNFQMIYGQIMDGQGQYEKIK